MTFDAREISTHSGEPFECYRFGLGGTFYRRAAGDQAVTINEAGGAIQTYLPSEIYRDEQEVSDEALGATLRIRLPSDDAVAQLFIPYTPVAPVSITVYRFHRDDTEVIVDFDGEVASAEHKGAYTWLTCLSEAALLARPIPARAYGHTCQWALYDPNTCKVNKAAFSQAATISNISGATLTATTFGSHPDGWWNNGYIERANGERRFVVSHAGNVVTLMSPFFGIALAEVVTAVAGCDRTEGTCLTKFNNRLRFRGHPRIPARNVHEKGLG